MNDSTAEVTRNGRVRGAPRPSRLHTDLGNAERFAEDHGGRLRYVGRWKKWLAWDGARFKVDDANRAMQLAKLTAKGIISEAEPLTGAEEQKAVSKHWIASQSRSRLEAMVALAASEEPFPVDHELLDADPWLLNCANGTVDLTTGVLLPHDPGRLMTLSTQVEYHDGPDPGGLLWQRFLKTTFAGDHELISFVQRLMGVALVGEQREHLLPVAYGLGANGKSVFMGAVMHAMGEYASIAPPGLLMSKRGDRHPTELASLFRKRLVVVSETRDNQRLDEGLVKAITGGDRIAARRMHEDFWEFTPSHIAIVVTNHKPVVAGADNGIWRRLRLLPFDVTIPAAEQDADLPTKLQREAPAILRWMVEGCLAWQRFGLGEPGVVMAATQEYREESDALSRWIAEECVTHPGASMRSGEAHKAYQRWCRQAGEDALGSRSFGEQLKLRFTTRKTNTGRFFEGVSLKGDG